jgi:hypothetical protein
MTFIAVSRSRSSREGVAGKGSNDLHSFLNNYIPLNFRATNVTELHIFFVTYAGQNSTRTVFRHFGIYRPLRVK